MEDDREAREVRAVNSVAKEAMEAEEAAAAVVENRGVEAEVVEGLVAVVAVKVVITVAGTKWGLDMAAEVRALGMATIVRKGVARTRARAVEDVWVKGGEAVEIGEQATAVAALVADVMVGVVMEQVREEVMMTTAVEAMAPVEVGMAMEDVEMAVEAVMRVVEVASKVQAAAMKGRAAAVKVRAVVTPGLEGVEKALVVVVVVMRI